MRGRCVGTTGARLSTTEGGCTAEEGRTVQNNWHADALLIEGKGGCCKERRWRFCRAPAGDTRPWRMLVILCKEVTIQLCTQSLREEQKSSSPWDLQRKATRLSSCRTRRASLGTPRIRPRDQLHRLDVMCR